MRHSPFRQEKLDPSEKGVDTCLYKQRVTSYYIPGITQRARFLEPASPTNELVVRMMPEDNSQRLLPALLSKEASIRSVSMSSSSYINHDNRRRHLLEEAKSASMSRIENAKRRHSNADHHRHHDHLHRGERYQMGMKNGSVSRLPKELLDAVQKLDRRQRRLHKKQKQSFFALHMLQDEQVRTNLLHEELMNELNNRF